MSLAWGAEAIRLTVFLTQPGSLENTDWKKITGQDQPETFQKTFAKVTLTGPYLGGRLTASVTGNRIDYILSPDIQSEAMLQHTTFPLLENWPAISKDFVGQTSAWLGELRIPVQRLAFGAVLLHPYESRVSAYKAMFKLMKSIHGDAERMRDFIYRINWPVQSKCIGGLLLNRITNWSAVEIRLLMQSILSSSELIQSPPAYFARLEIDHSTDANRAEALEHDLLVPIYEELASLAQENLEKGEIP